MKNTDKDLPFAKNDIIDAEISDMSGDGSGIAKKDGFTIFVENGVKGDICKIRILKCLKHYAYAKIESLTALSEYRTEPDCSEFYKCGGCRLRHISYQAELELKRQKVDDVLRRIGGVPIKCEKIIAAENIQRYRNKALLPVGKDKNGRIICGFYRKNSHDIVEADDCLIQNACVPAISRAVVDYMNAEKVCPYDEQSGTGCIRRIFTRTSSKNGEVSVMIVSAQNELPNMEKLVNDLREACPKITGIMLNINKERGNAAFGRQSVLLFGKDYIEDELCGINFRISPLSFFQINPEQAQKLYDEAIKMAEISKDTNVLDLYCGAGTITLCMAKNAGHAVGVEIIPDAIENAKENALRNGISNVEFICADAGEAAQTIAVQGYKPQVVTVDPPRKGLDGSTIDAVVKMQPDRVVYVSCDPATMARDVKIFAEKGYVPKKVAAIDMFPRTEHVETVCLLVRRNGLHINIDVDVEELLHEKRGQATYPQIKEYVLEQTGMKVSSLYISQVKRKCGLDVSDSYNKPKSEDAHIPQCPPEKEKAIMDALRHFGLIS